MSEFLAEASVLIRPDTSKFRATLLAELATVTKGIVIPVQVVASQQATRELRRTVTATEEVVAVRQKQAAVDAIATKQAVDLAEAQRLSAVATARLAEVEQADALAVTQVAGAKARLKAAEVALVASRRAQTASLAVENAELRSNVAATLASAEAQLVSARAAAEEAVAHARSSKEIAGHAAAEHALAKGAAATGLSLVGARGATLAASGAFLAGAAAVTVFEKSIHEASAETEAAARANKVFGDSAAGLEHDASGLADSFGLSTRAALDFEGRLGNLFHNAGIAQDESAALSEQLTKLAADMAAFANVPVETTLKAITLGLVGNSRGLRQFQVELSQARVTQEALTESGKEHAKQLTQEDRIRARINLLLQQTVNVQGAAAARSGQLAQREKVLKANLEDLGGTIGRFVIKPVGQLAGDLSDLIGLFRKAGDGAESLAGKLDKSTGQKKGGLFESIKSFATSSLFTQIDHAKDAFHNLQHAMQGEGDTLETNTKLMDLHLQGLHVAAERAFRAKLVQEFTAQIAQAEIATRRLAREAANVSFTKAINDVARLDEKLTDVKIAGGGPGAQLSVLKDQAAAARRAIDAATAGAEATVGHAGHDTAIRNRRAAKQQLLDTLTEIRGIHADQNAAAKKLADEIERAAEDAAQAVADALAAADQAFLDALGLKRGGLDIKQLRVEATQSLVDDVAFQRQMQVFLRQEIVAAQKTIANELLRAQTIQELTAALVQSQIAEKALLHQQAINAQQRRAEAFDRAAASVDLDIQLAQTNKDVRAEVRARTARIKLDQERLKAVRGDTLATKRLRNDIAEQRAAIKALKGDLDKRRKDLEQLEFEFLQTQSGFVANLLSNLLPTSAVAGTVGAGAISTRTAGIPVRPSGGGGGGGGTSPSGPSSTSGGGVVLGGEVIDQQQQSAQPRGVTQGQGTTTIQVLRLILGELRRISGSSQHPEAAIQRGKEAVSMDFFNW